MDLIKRWEEDSLDFKDFNFGDPVAPSEECRKVAESLKHEKVRGDLLKDIDPSKIKTWSPWDEQES